MRENRSKPVAKAPSCETLRPRIRDRGFPVDRPGFPLRLYVGVAEDVTDRVTSAQELRKSLERFDLVTRATHDALWEVDLRAGEVWWSDAYRERYTVTRHRARLSELGGRGAPLGPRTYRAQLRCRTPRARQHLWQASAARVDSLLTDVVMPRMIDGPQLAATMRTQDPSLRILLTTGYVPETEPRAETHDFLLLKPFTPRQLLQAVRRALSSPLPT